jgi:hypothetical protein
MVYLQHFSIDIRYTCLLIEKEKCLMQPVAIAEMNVRYHSSQKRTDQFIVVNASKSINQNSVVVGLDLAEALVEEVLDLVETTEVQDMVEVQEMIDQEKCLMQPVAIAEMNVRYHSSQKRTDQFIVKNVSSNTKSFSKLI